MMRSFLAFSDRILAGTDQGLFQSADRGLTWIPVVSVPKVEVTALRFFATEAYALVREKGVYRSNRKPISPAWKRMGIRSG